MWRYEKVALVKASRAVVWEAWANVEKWPQWDTDLSEAALLGELAVGTQGKMKVADDALITFVVAEVIPEERLVIKIAFFGATLAYSYEMLEEDGQLRITHGATISGIFGFFWRLFLKKKIEKTLPPALDAFVAEVAAESARREEIAAAAAPVSEDAPIASGDESKSAEQAPPVVGKPAGGDAVENELRAKDIHTQIEVAAHAAEPSVATVASGQESVAAVAEEKEAVAQENLEDAVATEQDHTAVVAVSGVITKKETKRSKE